MLLQKNIRFFLYVKIYLILLNTEYLKKYILAAYFQDKNENNLINANESYYFINEFVSDVLLIQGKYIDSLKEYYQGIINHLFEDSENIFLNEIMDILLNKSEINGIYISSIRTSMLSYGETLYREKNYKPKLADLVKFLNSIRFKYFINSKYKKNLILKLANTIHFAKFNGEGKTKKCIQRVINVFTNVLKCKDLEIEKLNYDDIFKCLKEKVIKSIDRELEEINVLCLLSWLTDEVEIYATYYWNQYDPFYSHVVQTQQKKSECNTNLLTKYINHVKSFQLSEYEIKIIDTLYSAYNTILELKIMLSKIYERDYINSTIYVDNYHLFPRIVKKNYLKSIMEYGKNNKRHNEMFLGKIIVIFYNILKINDTFKKKLDLTDNLSLRKIKKNNDIYKKYLNSYINFFDRFEIFYCKFISSFKDIIFEFKKINGNNNLNELVKLKNKRLEIYLTNNIIFFSEIFNLIDSYQFTTFYFLQDFCFMIYKEPKYLLIKL